MLWVVMPVFNEADSVEGVVREWVPVFKNLEVPWTFYLVDDGSTDETPAILDRLAAQYPNLQIEHTRNAGHGAACLRGYTQGLKKNATWFFQLDADGQCDPIFFPSFWKAKEDHTVILGNRTRRDDGLARVMISWCMQMLIWIQTGARITDANVPYRLIRSDCLSQALSAMPSSSPDLANAVLAILLVRQSTVHWIPIGFRARQGGNPSIRWWGFVRKGLQFSHDLIGISRRGTA